MAELVSYARRFTDLAAADPDRVLITCGDDSITRAGFEASANRLARDLQGRGVGLGDMVTIALPELDRLVRDRGGVLEARGHPAAGVVPAARRRAAGHRRAGRLEGRRRRRAGAAARSRVPARRPRAAPVDRGRAAARRHLAGVEGTDLRRFDRSAEADRVRRPGVAWTPRPARPSGSTPTGAC